MHLLGPDHTIVHLDIFGPPLYNAKHLVRDGVPVTVDQDFLKSTAYFSGLTPEEIKSVSGHVFEKAVPRLEMIEREGEPSANVYFVVSGVVKVFKTSTDGKEQILRLVKPGDVFSDAPLLADGTNLASAQALGPVVLYGINKADLELIIQRNGRVAVNVIRALSDRVRRLVELVEDLSFKNVMGRIAKILLEYSVERAPAPRLTQQEMAAMAGTAREMVGRTLKALEDTGTIKMDHHRIIIRDRAALGRLAGVSS